MLNIHAYKSQSELVRAHPEIKSLQVVHHIPRGQTIEHVRAVLKGQGRTGTLYIVGNFVWEPITPTPCSCYEKVGDNPMCLRHGGAAHHG